MELLSDLTMMNSNQLKEKEMHAYKIHWSVCMRFIVTAAVHYLVSIHCKNCLLIQPLVVYTGFNYKVIFVIK